MIVRCNKSTIKLMPVFPCRIACKWAWTMASMSVHSGHSNGIRLKYYLHYKATLPTTQKKKSKAAFPWSLVCFTRPACNNIFSTYHCKNKWINKILKNCIPCRIVWQRYTVVYRGVFWQVWHSRTIFPLEKSIYPLDSVTLFPVGLWDCLVWLSLFLLPAKGRFSK